MIHRWPTAWGEIIDTYVVGDEHYLFLPSWAGVNGVDEPEGQDDMSSESGEKSGKNSVLDYATEVMSEDQSEWNLSKSDNEPGEIIVMKSENLPSIHIWTDSGRVDKIWNDKEAFETGRLSIYDAQGEKLYAGGLKSVNTRGNYSFTNY